MLQELFRAGVPFCVAVFQEEIQDLYKSKGKMLVAFRFLFSCSFLSTIQDNFKIFEVISPHLHFTLPFECVEAGKKKHAERFYCFA
jgi:hypothetical protein